MTSSAQNSKQYLAQQGSATVPSYSFLGDQDTGVYRSGANELSITTNGTQRAVVDSSGNVGIGTSSPSARLDVVKADSPELSVRSTQSGSWKSRIAFGNAARKWEIGSDLGNVGNNNLYFYDIAASAERMRIDSSGNVGIGQSSPKNALDVNGSVTLDPPYATYLVNSYYDGAWKYVGNGNAWGIGNNFGGTTNGMTIAVTATNSSGAGAALTWNPAVNIDTSGTFLVGKTTDVNDVTTVGAFISAGGKTVLTTTGSNQPLVLAKNASTSGALIDFFYNGSTVGSVTTNGTGVTYGTSSDYRLKNSVTPLTTGLATVSALKPVTYKWNVDDSYGEGFIAHELQEVIPLAVTGEKDAVDEDGSIKPQGVDYSKIVVHLVAAIQEQQAQIEELKAKVAALEAK